MVADGASYRLGIHKAVLRSNGEDEYTGLCLRWDLISQYEKIRGLSPDSSRKVFQSHRKGAKFAKA